MSFGFDGGIGAPEPVQSNTWYHMSITIEMDLELLRVLSKMERWLIQVSSLQQGIPMDKSPNLNGDIAIGRMNHSAWDAFRQKLALTTSHCGTGFSTGLKSRLCTPRSRCHRCQSTCRDDGLAARYSFDSNLDDARPNNHDGQSDSLGFGEDAVGEAESSLRLELGEFVSLGMEDKLLNNGQDTLSSSFWSKPDQGALHHGVQVRQF